MNTSVKEAAERAAALAGEKLHEAGAMIGETSAKAREKAVAVRAAAGDAAIRVRAGTSRAGAQTADGIRDNPVAALVGGLALGVIAGALLPPTKREEELLGPIGARITDAAKAAAAAAREAGAQTLDELGVNSDSARGQASQLFDAAIKAATSAGEAATIAAKDSARRK